MRTARPRLPADPDGTGRERARTGGPAAAARRALASRAALAALVAAAVAGVAVALWTAAPPSDAVSPAPAGPAAAPAAPAAQPAPPAPASQAPGGAVLVRYVVVPEQSEARYRAGETILRFNRPNVAVGVTRAISGEILFDPQQPAASRLGIFTVDISRLQSDEPRRDQAIRERWLESARYPLARFQATSVEVGQAEGGGPVPVTLHGQLTIRDVTRPVTFQGTFQVEGDVLRATASTRILMTDFGFEPPSIAGLLRADNEVQVEVDIVARRSAG